MTFSQADAETVYRRVDETRERIRQITERIAKARAEGRPTLEAEDQLLETQSFLEAMLKLQRDVETALLSAKFRQGQGA